MHFSFNEISGVLPLFDKELRPRFVRLQKRRKSLHLSPWGSRLAFVRQTQTTHAPKGLLPNGHKTTSRQKIGTAN